MSNTTQTPADQSSELDAIRARVDEDYPSEIPHVEAPDPTCADIDSANRSVLATLKLCKKNDGDFSDAVAMELSDVKDQMECVRSANEQLRALGMASHEIAKDVLEKLNESRADSRRLLELLDERDVDRALEINAINNVLPDSEEDIAEARELMREWYDGLPAYDVAGLESLKTRTKNFIEGN
jgi:hypothetical protein